VKAKFKNSTSIERTKPSVGGRRETVKVSDQVEMLDWPKGGKSIAIRPVGPLAAREAAFSQGLVPSHDGRTARRATRVCATYWPSACVVSGSSAHAALRPDARAP
jgi:hypothetical protein